MNNKIIKCDICFDKMKEWQSNNPEPLLPSTTEDGSKTNRVCRNCNDYVTAIRVVCRGMSNNTAILLGSVISEVMTLASSLKRSRGEFIKTMEEE